MSFLAPLLGNPALLGGLAAGAGSIIENILGTRKKRSTLDPTQQQLLALSQQGLLGQGPLADLFGPASAEQLRSTFDQAVRVPALRGFEEDIIPRITGQFAGAGLRRSQSLESALSRAGRDLESNLAGQMQQFLTGQQQQRRQTGSAFISNLLGQPLFENVQSSPFTDILARSAPSIIENLLEQQRRSATGRETPDPLDLARMSGQLFAKGITGGFDQGLASVESPNA